MYFCFVYHILSTISIFFILNLQSYEKSSEMQKESKLFFSFPRQSNFFEAKNYEKTSEKPNLFELFRVLSKFGKAKVTKKSCCNEAILED